METIDFDQIEKWVNSYNESCDEVIKKQLLTLIVIACEPLVKRIAYGLARRGTDPVEDIIQVANIGLIKAVKRYLPSYKNLRTWFSYSIVGEIKHYLRDKANIIKPPREIIELSYRINKLSPENIEEAGNSYSEEIAAKKKNISKEKLGEFIAIERRHVISLDDIKYTDDDSTYLDNLPDEDTNYEYEYKMVLEDAVSKLPKKQRQIIIGIYFEGKLQSEIAKELHMFQSNVSRIQKQALNKLFDIIKEKEE